MRLRIMPNEAMKKNSIHKLLDKRRTEIYYLVNESFLNSFSKSHELFMRNQYYATYKEYCEQNKGKALPVTQFVKNAERRKRKVIQICCPYCGYTDTKIVEIKADFESLKYCPMCGRKSTIEYIFLQLSAFIRTSEVLREGIKAIKAKNKKEDLQIISYDVNHLQLIELTSILERTLRDFFIDLTLIRYKAYGHEYIEDLIRKSVGNDFMAWEKANKHYKKSLNIDLKKIINDDCRSDLEDLVNIRNVIIHNNGMIDEKFRQTKTYERVSHSISGDLIFITEDTITKYLKSVLELIFSIEKEFKDTFFKEMHMWIANYYFNS